MADPDDMTLFEQDEHQHFINVRYIYSACVVTETPQAKILHDPWFTEGAYDGSWFHFPEVKEPCDAIGPVDFVFVSHLHPDHYDPVFLRKYFSVFGKKKILIGNFKANHLRKKLIADGFDPIVLLEPMRLGPTTVEIIVHETGSLSDIDSAIVIHFDDKFRRHCVVNSNDVIFDQYMLEVLKNAAPEIDILLTGHTGAGPYPQTYFDSADESLAVEAQKKKAGFFQRYKTATSFLNPKVTIPFAGQYLLGGRLSQLNEFRGVADAVEVLSFDRRAVVLEEAIGSIDTARLIPNHCRIEAHSRELLERRVAQIQDRKMDYERLFSESEINQLPLKRLVKVAAAKARERSECRFDYFFSLNLPNNEVALLNANRSALSQVTFLSLGEPLPEPRSEITIDPRYLFGLLTGIYHWNNAEVGSQYMTKRVPNQFVKSAQNFLNFFAVV